MWLRGLMVQAEDVTSEIRDVKGMHRVRWLADGEPEMQCGHCYEFLPLTREFWTPQHGVRRCRACLTDARRAVQRRVMAAARAIPERHEAELAADRAKYRANLTDSRTYHREWWRRKRSRLAMAQKAGAA